jgi:hypothetical protein
VVQWGDDLAICQQESAGCLGIFDEEERAYGIICTSLNQQPQEQFSLEGGRGGGSNPANQSVGINSMVVVEEQEVDDSSSCDLLRCVMLSFIAGEQVVSKYE